MADLTAEASTAAGAAAATKAGKSRGKLTSDMNTFLTLLTSQLKNQDPLSPMDSTEFTNQLVQFAQVEQQINTNDNMEKLLAVSGNSQAAMAVGYLGKYVEAESTVVALQDGQAVFTYGLTAAADNVTIALYDEKDNLVRAFQGDLTQGLHKITWNGKDSYGEKLDDGTYRIAVTATSKKDGSIETWSTTIGKVTGIASDGKGGTLLGLGSTSVDLTKVLGVFNTLPSDEQLADTPPATDENKAST
ncbi:flagellar hook assembly protein FlgD [Rhodospirillum rubrum]|uniref:Basal-body rod modification protein FlgD n=1 Tax=Rhodospirillum rubrum (strain ATCC 11170 / ATH 1.1.1 / DSM 467 / LMG 4362 / NCIMB 8255 / S1) TaxID=269796 RepID=Q2RWZ4_RHORT|nr:flagellar hook assembly protein FlgD [Rhodospirillum rubrum]ABC21351.1 Flagellar hook capping protein [Rhodospirillum rubrum ATCC 11170]AEO47031.1 flagellar hook capping protein [Rhodospirillum rubrum F11]MBK5952937.1 flagellar hook capping protein [Rhodospirillum rubrum]QXG81031.1 flagellar hook assembly protein FlgD [Rhodospirillum rubrum]HAP99772.1 flagellar hook assembly protein FlgD [Rhodospirillum rubrum]